MRIIVAGGGIGGMATAVALGKVGLEPLVLEQGGEDREIGAGLGLAANAMKALAWLGAADFIRERAVLTESNDWRELESGAEIVTQPLAAADERYGEHYYCAHRGDLLESLVRLVPSDHVRLNARVDGFEERQDGVVARLASGEEVQGDLLIGADGLRSRVRVALLGAEEEARFTGTVTWRALIPRERVPARFGPRIVVWLGPRRHSMLYPVRRDLFNLSGFVPAEEVHREVWAPSPDTDDLRRSFVGACDDVTSLIEQADEALITPIYFRDPLASWGAGRVVLLGDAAHPSPPSAGMGAAMALEDAVVLARCLERHDGNVAALAEYASLRMERTRRMLVASRNNLAFFNEPDPLQMRARNGRFIGMQRLDPVGETGTGWLYAYDAATVVEVVAPPAAPSLRRPEARRAADLWRNALTLEDRAGVWRGERAGYERFLLGVCPVPEEVQVEQVDCHGVTALKVVPPGGRADGPALLHLHGGGFVLGSACGAVELAGRTATRIGGWALVPDYRLAPEHPFPAALDDALGAYRWLLEQGAAEIVLAGECAGAALCVSLAARLRDGGEPLPVVIHAVSPFCDLTVSGTSVGAARDPWFNRDILRLYAASYLHDTDPLSPFVSPVHADLKGLPPLLVHVAAGEALLDDAVALARTAEASGVDATLRIVDDSVHSFVLFDFLPEADEALDDFATLAASRRAGKRGPAFAGP